MTLRLTPARFALSYIALGVIALALLAVPLWYGFQANLGTFRSYIPAAEMQRLVDLFHRDGPKAVAAAVDAYAKTLPPDQVALFVDPHKQRLAGNLPHWPAQVPEVPGTYGLVIERGGNAATRVVVSHVNLPGGYVLLMGRESVIFDSLVARFWFGIAGAIAILLSLGLLFGWLLRRAHGQLEALVEQRTAQLQLSEERYALAMQASGEGHWDWKIGTDEYYTSPRHLEILGLPPGTTSEGRAEALRRIPYHPEDRARYDAAVADHFAGRTPRVDIQVRLMVRGELRWVHAIGMCLRDAAGTPVRYAGSIMDITEQKRAEEARRISEERYARALQASNDGIWEWNSATDEMFMSERARELWGVPAGAGVLTRAELKKVGGFHPEDLQRTEEAVAANRAPGGPGFDIEYRVITPGGEVRWVRSQGKAFSGAAGEPVRLSGSLTDITERKHAEMALRVSEERYERAMEGSDAGHWEWNIVNDEMFLSERAREMLALPPGTLPARRSEILELIPAHPDDRAGLTEMVNAALRSKVLAHDYRVIPAPGELRWLRVRAKVYHDARGAAVRMTGSLTDITERRTAEEGLRESEKRFRSLTELSNDFFWETDTEHRYTMLDHGLIHRAEHEKWKKLGKRPWDIPNTSPDEATWAAHRRTIATRKPFIDFALSRVDRGEERFYEISGEPRFDADGTFLGYRGVGRETTARVRAEQAFRQSQESYALAMEATGAGHWDWKIPTDEFYASPRHLEIGGFARDAKFASRAQFAERYPFHPEDRPKWQAAVDAHFAGKTPRVDIEVRILPRILPNGEPRWVRMIGQVQRDHLGRPLRYAGVSIDTTEAKLAEQALRVSEERHARAMEASAAGHWDWNMLTDELFVSERAREMFELPPGRLPPTRAEFLSLMSKYRADMDEGVAASLQSGTFDRVYRVVLQTGAVRWLNSRGKVYKDAAGTPVRMAGSVTDITERRRVEEALRASEERISLAMEASEEGYIDCDVQTDRFIVSERMREIFEVPPGTRIDYRGDFNEQFRFYSDEDARAYGDAIRTMSAQGGPDRFEFEFRVVLPSGKLKWIWTRSKVTRDAEGRALRRIGVVADVTARKVAEEGLRTSEDRFALAVAGSYDGVWDIDLVGRTVFFSARTRELCGLPPGPELVPLDGWFEALPLHPEDRPRRTAAVQAHLSGQAPVYEGEYRIRQLDGVYRWRHLHGKCVRDAGGKPLRMAGSISDIDARRRAEEALRESEARYERVVAATEAGFWDWNIVQDKYYVSPRLLEMAGLPPGTVIAGRADFMARVPWHAEDLARWQREMQALFASGESRLSTELRLMLAAGTRWVRVDGMCFRDAAGTVLRWTGSAIDVTPRMLAEEALRASEQRYELAMAASESGYWDWQIPSNRYFASPRALELAGFPPGTTWVTRDEYRANINMHPEDFAGWEAARAELFAGRGERLSMEVRYLVRGETRWHLLHAICKRGDTGEVVRWSGSATDITERKRAEEELLGMERKLRQAQRLEAMGTLAGGIAHDFNNILGAILAYGEMALRDVPGESRLARDLKKIMTAGERGRALVDRVLTFSRSAVGERLPVEVEPVVREVLDLIMAKLPPNVTVHPKLHGAGAAVRADATQVHQVVTNLATNAIHAMPAGGTLRVELAVERVEAPRAATIGGCGIGDHVVLTVADTGGGIPPEIVDRIFDPYFTTKEVGTGTGLGLSLVHGIVTGLDGAIDVKSTPGRGSTFTIHLPCCGEAAQPRNERQPGLPRGDGQRVLVVDDEELLMEVATRTLEDLGYVPVGFTSSAAALAAFRADPERFDALITDERMPEMSGSALIREVRGIRGRVPIVLMTGYLGGGLVEQAREAGADEVLKKPLSAHDVATGLARVLRKSGPRRRSPGLGPTTARGS